MFIAFLSLMLITTSITMYAMEIEKKVTWNEKVQIAPQKKPCRSQCSLIKATRNNQFDTVKKILCAPLCDPNKTDDWGSSALHHAAINERPEIMSILLDDKRTDPFIKNGDGKMAHELINTNTLNTEMLALREKLLAQAKLNLITDEQTSDTQ
jgi:hypothetical protein